MDNPNQPPPKTSSGKVAIIAAYVLMILGFVFLLALIIWLLVKVNNVGGTSSVPVVSPITFVIPTSGLATLNVGNYANQQMILVTGATGTNIILSGAGKTLSSGSSWTLTNVSAQSQTLTTDSTFSSTSLGSLVNSSPLTLAAGQSVMITIVQNAKSWYLLYGLNGIVYTL